MCLYINGSILNFYATLFLCVCVTCHNSVLFIFIFLCVTGWQRDRATEWTPFCNSRNSGPEEAAGRQRQFPASTEAIQLAATVRRHPSFSFVFISPVGFCLCCCMPVTHHVLPALSQPFPLTYSISVSFFFCMLLHLFSFFYLLYASLIQTPQSCLNSFLDTV